MKTLSISVVPKKIGDPLSIISIESPRAQLNLNMRSIWVSLLMKLRITLIIWKISPVKLISVVLKITHHVFLPVQGEPVEIIIKSWYKLEGDLLLSIILCWENEIRKERLRLYHMIKLAMMMMSQTQITINKRMKKSFSMKSKKLLKKSKTKR